MFLQIIEGNVRDAALLTTQMDAWRTSVKPGASGYLGTTSGVTDEGRFIAVARFESVDAARTNSQRSEQDAWWKATEPALADVKFIDCAEVDTFLGGGKDSAGFVQVMHGRATDEAKLREVGQQMEKDMPTMRPDVIGVVVGWHGDGGGFSQVVYFTSEAEARKGEEAESPEADASSDDGAASGQDPWGGLVEPEMTFLDLTTPQFD